MIRPTPSYTIPSVNSSADSNSAAATSLEPTTLGSRVDQALTPRARASYALFEHVAIFGSASLKQNFSKTDNASDYAYRRATTTFGVEGSL